MSIRVAIVHDWLTAAGGAERVLDRICRAFPQADLFTLFGDLSALPRDLAQKHKLQTSWLQGLPGIRRLYRGLAPLMPKAVEGLDLRGYDLVLSSSWAFAHGALADASHGARHLAYIHSPMRWAWDMKEEYLSRTRLPMGLRQLAEQQLAKLRTWDIAAAQRPQALLANSQFIRERIARCWSRDASVIYPPVVLPGAAFDPPRARDPRAPYLSVCRLVGYKRVDLLVKAFAYLPDRRLWVAGDGPEMAALRRMAPPNVEFLGWVHDEEVRSLMSECKAFLQASREDFGISVVEAQGCGTPVLAYGRGGARETVRGLDDPRPTGMFFETRDPEALANTIIDFERYCFSPDDCRDQAQRFSPEVFDSALQSAVKALLS